MKKAAALLLALVVTGGCGSARQAASDGIGHADTAELSGEAVARACELHCGESSIYVVDEIMTLTTREGDEEPMPADVADAIVARVDRAELISLEESHALFDGGVLTEPLAAVVYVGPVVELGEGIAAVDVGVATAHDGFRQDTYQFRQTARGWERVTPEDSGIPVTTAVS
jgi:hypothetical protein